MLCGQHSIKEPLLEVLLKATDFPGSVFPVTVVISAELPWLYVYDSYKHIDIEWKSK